MATERNVKFAITAEDRAAKVMAGVRASLGSVGDRAEGLNNSFGKLGLVFGSAFAGASFTAFIRSTVNSLDALNDLKDATGSSIENLSALENIGARTGTSFDSVSSSLVKFNKVLAESKKGSETANLLKSIGLNAEELKRIDPAEALQRTAIALQGFAADGKQARIIQELFGKSVKEAAPFLKDLAETGKLVGTVTTQQAEEAEKFNKQLFALQKNSQDAARALTSSMLPALNDLIAAFVTGRKEGKNFVLAALEAIDETTKKMGGFDPAGLALRKAKADSEAVQAQVKLAGDAVDRIQSVLKVNPGDERLQASLERAKAKLQELTQAASNTNEKLKNLANGRSAQASPFDALSGVVTTPNRPSAPDPKGATTEAKVTAYQKLIEKIRERSVLERAELEQGKELAESDKLGLHLVVEIADARNKLTDAEKRSATAKLEALLVDAKANEARAAQLKLVADTARLSERAQTAADQFLAGLVREGEARAQRNQQLAQEVAEMGLSEQALVDLRLARLDEAAATEAQALATARALGEGEREIAVRESNLALLREEIVLQRQGAGIQRDQAQNPRTGVRRAVQDYIDDTQAMGRNLQQLTGRTIDGLEDATTRLFTSQKTGFKQLVDDTIREIVRLQAVKPILASLFQAGSGGGGSTYWLGWLGTAASLASGSYNSNYGNEGRNYPAPTVSGSSAGSIDMPGRMGIQSVGGGGGVNVSVVQHISIGAGVSPSQVAQAMNQAKEQAKAEIAELTRRGSRAYS